MIIKDKVAVFEVIENGKFFFTKIYSDSYIPEDDEYSKFIGFTFVEIDTDAITQE